jgi:hypothetical protein
MVLTSGFGHRGAEASMELSFKGGVFVTSLFFLDFWVIAKLSAFLDQ